MDTWKVIVFVFLGVFLIAIINNFYNNSISGNVIYEQKNIYESYCENFGFEVGISFDELGNKYLVCVDKDYNKCNLIDFYNGKCELNQDLLNP